MSPRICLITPGHVTSTPRLVKEADTLVAAGYRVEVIAGQHFEPVAELDLELVSTAKWNFKPLAYASGSRGIGRKLASRAARLALGRFASQSVILAARAIHQETLRFATAAARTGADMFLGHCVPGIAAAALAAERRGTKCGFDLEDLHDAETDAVVQDVGLRRATQLVQACFLPKAAHLSAASPLIAAEYAKKYDVVAQVVLNAFPLSEAPSEPKDPGEVSPQNPARFYWFSQTIGPGRGLEWIVDVLARMQVPAELHLRGFVSPTYRAELVALAKRAGLSREIRFLPPAPASEMVRLAATAHVGLSLEQQRPLNRDVCLTNKIFAYLLAGIPQLMTDTSAQRAIAPQFGTAALLTRFDEPNQTAARLDQCLGDSMQYAQARREAWVLGRERFCWEREAPTFLDSIQRALDQT